MKVLLLSECHELVDLLGFTLRRAGLLVATVLDLRVAVQALQREQPDLIVLEFSEHDPYALLRELRRRTRAPILVLADQPGDDELVQVLELGAHDYIRKPFSYRELVARIRAVLRRQHAVETTAAPTPAALAVGPLRLNELDHSVLLDERPISLTRVEFRLLHYLMAHAGSVIPRQILLREVWGDQPHVGPDVLRVATHRLRRKLHMDPAQPQLIHTMPSVGVMLKVR
jgi:DNA-binding response OmpR family regulator